MNDVVGRGTLLAGRYRVLHSLPSSLAGATLWSASDQILDRPVSVTILTTGNVTQALDAARRAALVTDPRLVRILDVGDVDGAGYVVSETVTGHSLAELVAHGPLTSDQARAIIGEAAEALEVARRRGVHHLALRPSVVHLSDDGRVMISGLALDGALLGQGLGDALTTTRADTVGLVRLLYTALTGRWPAAGAGQGPDQDVSGVQAAPVVQGAPVPPADLVAGVPNDLDTLCVVTLGTNDDGPHSPAELVNELEPWGDIRSADLLGGLRPSAHATPAAPPAEPAHPSGTVQRQSVRSAFGTEPSAGTGRPGTPPPAIPPRSGVTRPDGVGGAGAGAVAGMGAAAEVFPAGGGAPTASTPPSSPVPPSVPPRTSVLPSSTAGATSGSGNGAPASIPPASVPPARIPALPTPGRAPEPEQSPFPQPVGGAQPRAQAPASTPSWAPSGGSSQRASFDAVLGEEPPLTRRRFDPTKLVLALVAVALLIGVVIAAKGLFSPIGDRAPSAKPVVSSEPSATESTGPAPSAAPSPSPSIASTTPPTIASVASVDPPPAGDNNEHPDIVGRAVDGDPGTFWYSRTYNQPDMGGKPGIGFALTLAQKSTVKAVTLHVNGTGGMVEVRATDAANPTTGTVLASGPLSADTVLTLSAPTETSSIVLWFTSLPQTADAKNRIELAEVTVS